MGLYESIENGEAFSIPARSGAARKPPLLYTFVGVVRGPSTFFFTTVYRVVFPPVLFPRITHLYTTQSEHSIFNARFHAILSFRRCFYRHKTTTIATNNHLRLQFYPVITKTIINYFYDQLTAEGVIVTNDL